MNSKILRIETTGSKPESAKIILNDRELTVVQEVNIKIKADSLSLAEIVLPLGVCDLVFDEVKYAFRVIDKQRAIYELEGLLKEIKETSDGYCADCGKVCDKLFPCEKHKSSPSKSERELGCCKECSEGRFCGDNEVEMHNYVSCSACAGSGIILNPNLK
jgi:hypothetical protein